MRNWLNFASLDSLTTSWAVVADSGAVLASGDLTLPAVSPGCARDFAWWGWGGLQVHLALWALTPD